MSRFRHYSWCGLAVLLAAGCSSKPSTSTDGGSAGTDGGSAGADGGTQPSYPTGDLAGQACDPMVPTQCGFPFPSNVYLVNDSSTPTGKRVHFLPGTLPSLLGTPTDPTALNQSDGFSPGQAPLTQIIGATVTGLPTQDTIADSLKDDCPTVLLDTSTDPPTRVPHFAELDVSTSIASDQTFMIRPVVRLKDATRYIVAIRNVVDSNGQAIPPTPVFQALRDGTASSDPTVASRQALYADIFAKLKAAGIDKSNLQIAWDYTTASRENNTGQLLSMRDQAMAAVGASGPTYTITSHEDNPDQYIARRIEGTVHVPLFLDHGAVTIDSNPGTPDLTTGFTLQRDANGMPKMNGYADYDFIVQIPKSVAMDTQPAPILIQQHGLFSDRSEGQDANSTDYNYLLKLAQNKKYVTIALDEPGWRTPGSSSDVNQEDDQEKAQGIIGHQISTFQGMIDRGTQGIINQLVAVRMMKTSFAKDPLVQFNGHSAIDTNTAYYRGDSQGGILGITYMALSQDITRGFLGEPGMPYNLLLMRSKDFSPFLTGLNVFYSNARNTQVILGAMQMFWDRLEGNGFAPYITQNTLPNTPSHNVFIVDGLGDFQVTPLGAHILARAVGAENLQPSVREIYGLNDAMSPNPGNSLLEFDFGVTSMAGVTVPETDLPPTGPSSADPHDKIRNLDPVFDMTDTFLRTGQAQNDCMGKCVFPENQ